LLPGVGVRVLEARFHPDGKDAPGFVVVGHIVWGWIRRDHPRVRPAPLPPHVRDRAAGTTSAAMLSKLEYLVALTSPGAFERLQALPNRFWSFVDVSAAPVGGGRRAA
jgi:hypothetical protein